MHINELKINLTLINHAIKEYELKQEALGLIRQY